jgi:hypothetical protein
MRPSVLVRSCCTSLLVLGATTAALVHRRTLLCGLFSHFIELVFYRETEVHVMVSDLSGSAWALVWTWE